MTNKNDSDPVLLRLSSEFDRCVETCNNIYDWYSRRERPYQNDDIARSWLRLIEENFRQAKALHYIRYGFDNADGSVPGINYRPGPSVFSGKTS